MVDSEFGSEQDLTDWIRENSRTMFGEELKWNTLPNLNADLLGTDKNGKSVIIEVKNWDDGYSSNRDKQEYQSIGQILHYANIFQKQHPDADIRLFIISNYSSEKVETCCEFLRVYGFDIQHLSVQISKLEESLEAAEKLLEEVRMGKK